MWGVTLGAKDIGALAASTGESTLFSLEMLKTSLGEHLAKMLEKKSRVCDGNDLELFLSLQISNFPFSPPPNSTSTTLWRAESGSYLICLWGDIWATVSYKHEEAWARKERKIQPKMYHELYIAMGIWDSSPLGPLRSIHNAIQNFLFKRWEGEPLRLYPPVPSPPC